ncbi:hypothetical protein SAMN05216276_1018146 [Streptosporangium subroseum]|uniref:Uncharacterized protein n=1 Tax=Streptosporangium subroseum TaxID=106412 RepID=A0A239I671_9ACTN|nr:hypothetical protein [Streptosporangium subroseum]SNS89019.1 hypothetical protein SAMN05216276_1018146 [Streptosporangium subroseum]
MRKSHAGNSVARAPLSLTASIVLLLALGAPAASASGTASSSTVAWRADSLAITVPTSADLGSGTTGGTISASLGTVTVVDTRVGLLAAWTAIASATDFTTGSGSSAETITKDRFAYWSGPVTASTGSITRTPGQPTAAQQVSLSTPVTAFSAQKLLFDTSTSWAPTLVVTIPASAVAGSYTGVITHSVA